MSDPIAFASPVSFRAPLQYLRRIIRPASRALWHLKGCPAGDGNSFFKHSRLIHYGRVHDCTAFIESGTYLGDAVAACYEQFEQVHTIEISQQLYLKAKRRFRDKKQITVWHGNSGEILPTLVDSLRCRALFWLDGHYSGGITARGPKDCPILEELKAISGSSRDDHVILIDDARHFGTEDSYPPLADLFTALTEINKRYLITVQNDCIIATPPR